MAERRKGNPSNNPTRQQGRRGNVDTTGSPSSQVERESSPRIGANLRALAEVVSELARTSSKSVDVNPLLATIGEAAEVDRVYIFKFHDEGGKTHMTQTHEWCQDDVSAQLNNPLYQNYPLGDATPDDWYRNLGKGECVTLLRDDVSTELQRELDEQDVQSMLHAPIITNEGLWGFVGFDDCNQPRQWSQVERDMLCTFGGALAIASRCLKL